MNTLKSSIHILYTENSRRDEFDKTIEAIKALSVFNYYVYTDLSDFRTAIQANPQSQISIVILHLNSKKDGEKFWRDINYEVKAQNKFTEVIVIISDEEKKISISAKDVLSSGCFAFFQYPHEPEVLLGYILAAQDKAKERQNRFLFSETLNISKDLGRVVNVAAEQLKRIVDANNVMLIQLKESTNEQGYLPKILYPPNIDLFRSRKILKPSKKYPLIHKILTGKIKRRIFPNPQKDEEIKADWEAMYPLNKDIKSWIVLPLEHDDKVIGLILLDSDKEGHFNYGKVNEAALEQLANQAATSIRLAEKNDTYLKLEDALKAINSSASYEETLQKLAKEACNLVGALFSYIVTPSQKKDWLNFVAAWSEHHQENFIKELIREVRLTHPITGITDAGFPLAGEKDSRGITTLAFYKEKLQLLNCISGKDYFGYEEDPEIRQRYHEFLYRRTDSNGTPLPALILESDIAIPIIGPKKEVLGIINVEHQLPFVFTEEHIKVLERLAEFAAIAITKKKSEDLLQALMNSKDFSIDINENIRLDHNTPTKRIENFLNNLAEEIYNISKAGYISVFSVKDNISFCVGRHVTIEDKIIKGITKGARTDSRFEYGHTFWSIKNKAKIVIPDRKWYEQNLESFEDIYKNQYKRPENNSFIKINENVDKSIQALICIPMLDSNGNAVGVIWMHHQADPGYSLNELEHFQKYANKAANALVLAEAITFKDIQISIGQHQDEGDVLSETVNLAKNFFGIEGVSIYKANRPLRELTRVKTTLPEIFPLEGKIKFREGLAGHLIEGKNKGKYKYSEGYVPVHDYSTYEHSLDDQTDLQKEKLGSVVGIRLPNDVPAEDAVGILVFFEEPKRERTYDLSKEKLIRLANFVGFHLRRIWNTPNPSSNDNKQSGSNLPISSASSPAIIINNNGNSTISVVNSNGDDSNITNKSYQNNGLNGDEVRALFKDVLTQLEKTTLSENQKEEALVSAKGIQEELVKGEKADEHKLEMFFRTLLNMAPDIFEVAVAAAVDPRLAASLIAQKVISKIKSGM